ncbi:MAG: gliding motility protein GldN [Flavicella sp.]
MKLKSCLVLVFVFLLTLSMNAQAKFNLLNAKKPSEIGVVPEARKIASKDKPLPYGYVDERDILWSKIVWEYIDLNERINMPLYYPIDSTFVDSNRKSLFYSLLKGIKSGKIKEVYDDSFFKSKLSMKDINQKLTRIDTADQGFDRLNSGFTNISEFIDRTSINSSYIVGYSIKGIWYFDKKHGELKYRLLAIAPMAPDVQTLGKEGMDEDESIPLFWVFYPSAREVLHNSHAFNENNSKSPISFDDILNARRFNSIISREENLYGNRAVSDYIQGNALFQIMESERIRESIRNKELDMWNY